MKVQLKGLRNIVSENCVTIILNTHRTRPDNETDPLTLKNLVKEAEERLYANEDKRDALALVERIKELASGIDHNQNLESLVLFVNEDIAQYVRLPVAVEDRVIIDETFATRDLVRALHIDTNYYVLVLSQQKVRLLEAFNDKVVAEIRGTFPIENTQFYTTNKVELSNATRQRNLMSEFFNRVDKEVNKVRKSNPAPVLLCTEESNYHEYLKVADQKHSIFEAFLNKNRLGEKAHAIVAEAWRIVKAHEKEKNDARVAELRRAVGQNKFLSDANEIWKAIKLGKIQTIFVEQGRFQPALWENDHIQFVSNDMKNNKEVVDDIYDELIEANLDFGGDVVFLPKGELDDFDGFGAIVRY